MACGDHLFPYCELMVRRSRKCPICGETGIPILYGYPDQGIWLAGEQGLIQLGGCIVYDDQPTWWCETDQYGWDGPDPDRAIRVALQQVASTETPLGLD